MELAISTDNGLASDSISYIIEDDAGYLWIGSNAGLMRIPKKSLERFRRRRDEYHIPAGLMARPTACRRANVPAARNRPPCRTTTERLWFPTTKGLASVNPADIQTQSAAAGGHDRIRAGGRPRTKDQPLGFGMAAMPSSFRPAASNWKLITRP